MTAKHIKIFLLPFFVSISTCGIAQNNFNAKVTAEKIIEHYIVNNYSVDTVLVKTIMEELTREQTEQVIEVINSLKEENQRLKTEIISLLKEKMSEKSVTGTKFNPKSLIPSWVQFERGDKCKAHLFLWSEVVFIPSAAVSWSQYCKYKKLSETPSRNQDVYETNRDVCLGLGIGTTALAVGFYVWNIIDGNTSKDKKIAFMPYATPSEYGVALLLKF